MATTSTSPQIRGTNYIQGLIDGATPGARAPGPAAADAAYATGWAEGAGGTSTFTDHVIAALRALWAAGGLAAVPRMYAILTDSRRQSEIERAEYVAGFVAGRSGGFGDSTSPPYLCGFARARGLAPPYESPVTRALDAARAPYVGDFASELQALQLLSVDLPRELSADLPVVLDRVTSIHDTGSGTLRLALAPVGHREGGEVTLELAIGQRSAIFFPLQANVTGDYDVDEVTGAVVDFDPAKAHTIALGWVAGRCVGTIRALAALDVTVLTVVSATVNGASPTQMVLVLSAAAVISSVDGLRLLFSAGTQRSIVGIEGGSGTNTITVTLSGAFSGAEVCSLVVDSSTIQKPSGVALSPSTTPVTVAFGASGAIPGAQRIFRGPTWALDTPTNPTHILSATDLVNGGLVVAAGALRPTVTTIGTQAKPAALLRAGANSYFEAALPNLVATRGAIALTVRQPVAGVLSVFVAFGSNATPGTFELALYTASSLINAQPKSGAGAGDGLIQVAHSLTTVVDFFYTWDHLGGSLYRDGVLVGSGNAGVVPNLGRVTIGSINDHSLPGVGDDLGDLQWWFGTANPGVRATLADAQAYHAWRISPAGVGT